MEELPHDDITVTTTRRVVQSTQVRVDEIPAEESITELVFDDSMPIPEEVSVEESEKPTESVPEPLKVTPVSAPKAKKPTSPWEAPEDFEILFEKVIETKTGTTERVKHEDVPEEKVETLPTYATSTAQLALYETTKPTVTMTFNVPEEAKEGIDATARCGGMIEYLCLNTSKITIDFLLFPKWLFFYLNFGVKNFEIGHCVLEMKQFY